MAFGFAGAGAGAAKGLEEILAEQMVRAQLAQRQKEAAERQALDQQQFEAGEKERESDRAFRQTTLDRQSALDRDKNNQKGVRRMIGESLMQRTGPLGPEDRRSLAAMQVEAGDLPDMSLLSEPPPKMRTVTVRGSRGEPINKVVPETEAVEEYREPKTGGSEKGPYVVGGNLVDASGKIIFRAQDNSAAGPSPYAQERNARTVAAVDDVIKDVNGWSAGYGSLLSGIPESQALNLKSKLSTLKANVAFNELTAMREASKTGGALGSIAVRELELLESALGSLDQAQSPEQLIENLNKVKASAERWQQVAGAKATGMQPVTSHDGAATMTPPPATPQNTPKRMRFDKTGNPIP